MLCFGDAPFHECSSRGDARFSALFARLKSMGNRTIEDIYQGAKIFEGGETGLPWRKAKGRTAINAVEVRALYKSLWEVYFKENPELIDFIKTKSGFSDIFGQEGHACQAEEIWIIQQNALLT